MNILITGATGFVGSELARELLLRGACKKLYLMIRPEAGMNAEARFLRLLTHWQKFVETPSAEQMQCVEVISYDLTGNEKLPPISDLDFVYHTAASTDLGQTLSASRRDNLQATQRALLVARQSAGLKRFIHYSTAFVSGKRRGTVLEESGAAPFNNHYERCKREAEDSVTHSGLSYVILRPSIIVGRSDNGYVWRTKVLYSVWRVWLSGVLKMAPLDAKSWVDVVPIDFVISASIQLADLPASRNQSIHLCAGNQRVSPETIMRAAARGFEVPIPRLSPSWFSVLLKTCPWLFSYFISASLRQVLRSMLFHLPYLGMRNRVFSTAKIESLLPPHEVLNPKFTDYGEGLFRFCKVTSWGKKALKPATNNV